MDLLQRISGEGFESVIFEVFAGADHGPSLFAVDLQPYPAVPFFAASEILILTCSRLCSEFSIAHFFTNNAGAP
jgi:hypothetical protein